MTIRDGQAKSSEPGNNNRVKKVKPIRKEKWSIKRIFKENDFSYIDEIAKNQRKSQKGANGYKVSALFSSLLFMYLVGIESILDLVKYLENHPEWVRFLKLERTVNGKKVYKVPDRTTYYKLPQRLNIESSTEILIQMVIQLMECGIITGESISVDATLISAHYLEKKDKYGKPNKSRDRDAAWTYDSYRKIYVYGYKIHILLDVKTALPIGIIVTNAKYGENRTISSFVELLKSRYPMINVENLYGDAGYDGNKTRLTIIEMLNATPYISLNPRNCKGNSIEEKMARCKKLREKFYKKNFIHNFWVDPDSLVYKEHHAKRTFSEQTFSISKGTLKLDNFHHRGLAWATLHLVFVCVSMIAVAKTAVAVGRPDLLRCIKCFNGI